MDIQQRVRQAVEKYAKTAEEPHWITINGTRVLIGDDGKKTPEWFKALRQKKSAPKQVATPPKPAATPANVGPDEETGEYFQEWHDQPEPAKRNPQHAAKTDLPKKQSVSAAQIGPTSPVPAEYTQEDHDRMMGVGIAQEANASGEPLTDQERQIVSTHGVKLLQKIGVQNIPDFGMAPPGTTAKIRAIIQANPGAYSQNLKTLLPAQADMDNLPAWHDESVNPDTAHAIHDVKSIRSTLKKGKDKDGQYLSEPKMTELKDRIKAATLKALGLTGTPASAIHEFENRLRSGGVAGYRKSAPGQLDLFGDDDPEPIKVATRVETTTKTEEKRPLIVDFSKNVTVKQEKKVEKSDQGAHWITIHASEMGGKGSHIQINDDGDILKGPKALTDKGITNMSDFKKVHDAVKETEKTATVTTQRIEPKLTREGRKQAFLAAGHPEPEAEWMSKMSWNFMSDAEKDELLAFNADEYDQQQSTTEPDKTGQEPDKVDTEVVTDQEQDPIDDENAEENRPNDDYDDELGEIDRDGGREVVTNGNGRDNSSPDIKPDTKPDIELANRLADKLRNGDSISAKEFFATADDVHGGTRAEGVYHQSQAYDSLEAAVNKSLTGETDPRLELEAAREQAHTLDAMVKQLPTQTNRTGNKESMQQFSTPPHYAYAVNWIANPQEGETVLEPSAGTGSLAIHAKNAGADVYVNELDPARVAFLADQFGEDHTYDDNAEHISSTLPDRGAPQFDKVIMNPPFSQTAGRLGNQKNLMEAADQIEDAARLLKPDGRLVSIVGRGMSPESPTYRDWFAQMAEDGYDLRANILVDGSVYKKYGTQFDSRVLVFDKREATFNPIIGEAKDVDNLMAQLEDLRNENLSGRTGPEPSSERDSEEMSALPGRQLGREEATDSATGADVAGDQPAADSLHGRTGISGEQPDASVASGSSVDADQQPGTGRGGSDQRGATPTGTDRPGRTNAKGGKKGGGSNRGGKSVVKFVPDPTVRNVRPAAEMTIETIEPKPASEAESESDTATNDLGDSLFEEYKPQSMHIAGAVPHITALVESAAMSAVTPPVTTYKPMLSPDIVEKGKISEPGLEAITYAGQAHDDFLPERTDAQGKKIPARRRGWFLGWGAGCVGGETRIYNPITKQHSTVEDLYRLGKPHAVLSLTEDGFKPFMAEVPFIKGIRSLHRVTLQSGRSVVVTDNHRFLTPVGWQSISEGLLSGHFLACAAGHQVCNLGFDPSVHDEDARHLSQTPEDCLDDYSDGFRPYGGRLRTTQGIGQEPFPSQGDAHTHNRVSSYLDDQATSHTSTRLPSGLSRHSKNDSSPSDGSFPVATSSQETSCDSRSCCSSLRNDQKSRQSLVSDREDFEVHLHPLELTVAGCTRQQIESEPPFSSDIFECTTPLRRSSQQSLSLEHCCDTDLRSDSESPDQILGMVFSSDYTSLWDRVTSIEFVRTDEYYDLHVPGPENYVAEGVVHHNTGKGRVIAGIIADNHNRGRTKAVWLSKTPDLFHDAQRDIHDIGEDGTRIHDFNEIRKGKMDDGIAFMTYAQLRSKPEKSDKTNLDLLVDWLGADFDGVIAFDESHLMSNGIDSKGNFGNKSASQQALAGIELQARLPNARIVYSSATGATEPRNLAYADRLGIWGPGTAFNGPGDFFQEMDNGGVAAMEQVAQSLKATGSYSSLSIAMDNGKPNGKVEYDKITHHLTEDQHEQYNALSDAWQNVLEKMEDAVRVTGGGRNGQSQFWGAQQRFFNNVITSMQTPAVIAAMEEDLANGRSPVIQLVNTGESQLKNALANRQEGQEDSELDVSPRQILKNYLEHSFPMEEHEEYLDENGNKRTRVVMKPKRENGQIVLDSKGKPVMEAVLNPKAVAMRDELMEKVDSMRIPESPIDQIMNHFNHKNVAEITGRHMRNISLNDGEPSQIVKRNPGVDNMAEQQSYRDGSKKILIFSGAGDTGFSYQASPKYKNQDRRAFYMLQTGWRADAATQALGRVHRANQVSAPIYHMVEIADIPAQKRFISTIARRLDQLGALTKGERKAGSSGIFDSSDNLETVEAKKAMISFFHNLSLEKVPGIHYADALKQLGLASKEQNARENGQKFEPPPVTQFMNRMLVLRPDMQQKMYKAFRDHIDQEYERAIENGTLDQGMENFPAESIRRKKDIAIHKDPRSGAPVRLITATVKEKTDKRSWADGTKGDVVKFVRNRSSGQVWAVRKGIDSTDDKGNVTAQVVLVGPRGKQYRAEDDLAEDGYNREKRKWISAKFDTVDETEAKRLWDQQYEKIPEFTETEQHFVTGALLPVWDKIPSDRPRIYRMRMTDGTTVVGRHIPPNTLPSLLSNFNYKEQETVDVAKDAHAQLSAGTHSALLANGWRLTPKKIQGEKRIELTGPTSFSQWQQLVNDGVIKERVGSDYRYFVPVGERGKAVMETITSGRPVKSMAAREKDKIAEFQDGGDSTPAATSPTPRSTSAAFMDAEPAEAAPKKDYKSELKSLIKSKISGMPLKLGGNTYPNKSEIKKAAESVGTRAIWDKYQAKWRMDTSGLSDDKIDKLVNAVHHLKDRGVEFYSKRFFIAEDSASRAQQAVERYSRQRGLAERYSKPVPEGMRWITLHARDGESKGVHVLIKGDGGIQVGPKALVGQNVKNFHKGPKPAQKPRPPKVKPPKVGPSVMSVDDIHADPGRFQYKVSGISSETGTTGELKKVKEYNPMLGGQLLVWEDPADHKTYVVNGHHRLELAKRSPRSNEFGKFSGTHPVYHIPAKTAEEARAWGAYANIAEGRGTATDAAKFMRDMNAGMEEFQNIGISPSGAVANLALELKKLSPNVFQQLTQGKLSERRAGVIGKHIENQDAQDQFVSWLAKREKPGREFGEGKLSELARALNAQKPNRVNGGGGLFDDWFDQFPVEQRADIADYVRRNLGSEKRTLKDASSSRRKALLESSDGNKLDVEGNRVLAHDAEARAEEFDRRSNAAGHPIALALDEFAQQLFTAKPKERDKIMKSALEHVRKLTLQEDSRNTTLPPVNVTQQTQKSPWEMNHNEWLEFAKGGNVVKATGKNSPEEQILHDRIGRGDGNGITHLQLGEAAGYSPQDIAHFYWNYDRLHGIPSEEAHQRYLRDAKRAGKMQQSRSPL